MATLKVNTQPLVPRDQAYPPGVGSAPDAVLQAGGKAAQEVSQALHNIEARLNLLDRTLRQQSTVVDKIAVVDSSGKVLAALGDFIFNGVPTTNYFSEIHVGDPLNTGDPSQALFNAANGMVTIGQNGSLDVLDPYGADAAWIGAQFDTLAVTGAADNGSGLIRLTVTGQTLSTGDVVHVLGVGGVPNATGIRTITSIDANHIDLQNTVFVGAYTSGGTVDRLLHIAGVTNAAGLARIQTAAAHTYESGDRVHIAGVGSGLNGQWTISVIDATHFDLVGSTFTGGTNGTSLRFFAGGLFQTIAIGPSFVDYRLRMFADGSMRLRNAIIVLTGTDGSITIDPTIPSFKEVSTSTGFQVRIESGVIYAEMATGGSAPYPRTEIAATAGVTVRNSAGVSVGFMTYSGTAGTLTIRNSATTQSVVLDGATGTLTASGDVDATGNVNAAGYVNSTNGYKFSNISGVTTNLQEATSLTVNTIANGLRGTPGVGQSNLTLVTGVSLNVNVHQVLGGILTT